MQFRLKQGAPQMQFLLIVETVDGIIAVIRMNSAFVMAPQPLPLIGLR